MKQKTESQIQAKIFYDLTKLKYFCFMVPNDAAGATNMRKAMKLKSMGLRAGVSDLVVVLKSGHIVFLEVKRPNQKLSPSQKEFQELCLKNNWPYAVVYNSADAVEFLERVGNYYKLKEVKK